MNSLIYKIEPYFEENLGQLPKDIKYKVNANDYITFFKGNKLIISLPSNRENARNIFYMKLENKNIGAEIKGQDRQIGIVNYLIGKDESKWITNIPTYSKIKYKEIYDNIDLYYYINNGDLEYDFVLSPSANPNDICISFEGIDSVEIDNENTLISIGDIRAILLKPQVYQIINNIKTDVECEYKLNENNQVSFLLGEYEEEFELILDPVLKLDYSTYIGGRDVDSAYAIAVDKDGCVYITGNSGANYPITEGACQTKFRGSYDVVITKINSSGSNLVYSTYLGGSEYEVGNGITVDSNGCVYITGQTSSNDFPVSPSAYQNHAGGNCDVFVSKIHESGTLLVYSTYLGGTGYDIGNSIYVDKEGCAYITGQTSGKFPTTLGAYQTSYGGGDYDAFVSKLDKYGSELVYSTYIGGNRNEYGKGIEVDKEGDAYITGYTGGNYPTTLGAYQTRYGGGNYDVFVSKLDKYGSKLIYSTYIGGSSDEYGIEIAVDSNGDAYITGQTTSIDYPTLKAYQSVNGGEADIIVSKLDKYGSELVYSTYIGGSGDDGGTRIVVDSSFYAYIVGFMSEGTSKSVFLGMLDKDGSELVYSKYLNATNSNAYGEGIVVGSEGSIYIAGNAGEGYPTTNGAYQTNLGGGYKDIFVSKLLPIEFDVSFRYEPRKIKLLDNIKTVLCVQNLSSTSLDINIRCQLSDNSISFIPNSLSIQNITQQSSEIPSQIYIPNVSSKQSIEIKFDIKYINEKYPQQIPIIVIVECYENVDGIATLIYSRTETFYMNTIIGPNYIPGCNKNLYNLAIDGILQTTDSEIPIIYYKSGTSYIYAEPNEGKYIYKVLANQKNIVEYLIN